MKRGQAASYVRLPVSRAPRIFNNIWLERKKTSGDPLRQLQLPKSGKEKICRSFTRQQIDECGRAIKDRERGGPDDGVDAATRRRG